MGGADGSTTVQLYFIWRLAPFWLANFFIQYGQKYVPEREQQHFALVLIALNMVYVQKEQNGKNRTQHT